MATLSFKVLFNDQARRFKLTDADFATFQAKAQDVFGLSASQPIFQWKDSDDDYITINSQEEFDEAVAEQTISSASSVIKIYVSESTSLSPVRNPSQEQVPHTTTSKDSNLQDQSQEESNRETNSPNVQQQEQEQDSQAQQDPTPSPPPPPEPVTHPHVECDGSGQSPLRGIRFHKIGENYDLNEAEFSKLDEGQKTQFELILYPGAQPIRWEPVVHYNIVCDASNVTPIFGIRFHKVGEDYDLSFTEFTKLSEEEKRGYELLNHPRAKPIPYYTPPISEDDDEEEEAVRQLFAAMVGGLFNIDPNDVIQEQHLWQRKGCPRQRGCPRRRKPKNCRTQCENSQSPDSQCAKNNETSTENQSDNLPQAPAAIGSYGPGIVRLQKFLIEHDLMDASAIRWRAGVFGPRTQEAIYTFQLANKIETEQYGVYDEPTAAALQALVKEDDSTKTECATPIDTTKDSTNEDTNTQLDDTAPPHHEEVATTQTSAENNDKKTEDTTESQHNKAEDDDLVVVDSTDVESVEPVEPTREPTSVSSQSSTSAAADKDWTEELKILKSMGFVNEKALVHLLNHNKEADPSRPLEATIAALLR